MMKFFKSEHAKSIGLVILSCFGIFFIWVLLNEMALVLVKKEQEKHPARYNMTKNQSKEDELELKKELAQKVTEKAAKKPETSSVKTQILPPAASSAPFLSLKIKRSSKPEWSFLSSLDPAFDRPVLNTSAPRVHIIISNVGMMADLWKRIQTTMAGKVTVSFSPYAPNLPTQITEGRGSHFKILLDLPMESHEYPKVDTGPYTLLTGVPASENQARYEALLKSINRVDGFLGIEGDRFLLSERDASPIFFKLKEGNFFFVDPSSTIQSKAMAICQKVALACHAVTFTIEEDALSHQIEEALSAAKVYAKENGSVIIRVIASPKTVIQIDQWIKTTEAQGFIFEPLGKEVPLKKAASW